MTETEFRETMSSAMYAVRHHFLALLKAFTDQGATQDEAVEHSVDVIISGLAGAMEEVRPGEWSDDMANGIAKAAKAAINSFLIEARNEQSKRQHSHRRA